MKNSFKARKTVFPLIFMLLLSLALSYSVSSALAQEVVPDELMFKWTKPEEIWTHGNPLISGTKGFIIAIAYEPLAISDDISMQYGILYKPILAESWSWVDDTTFEIKLRKIGHFSSGRPVTADDVVFSLENELREDITGALAAFAPMIDRVQKVDDYIVRLNLRPEYARSKRILQILTGIRVLNKDQWSEILEKYGKGIIEYKNTDPSEGWDVSGPYTLVSWSTKVIYMKRVDNYWGEQLGWQFAPEYAVCFGDLSSDALFRLFDAHERDMNSQSPEISVEWQRERSYYLGAWNMESADPRMIHGVASDSHGLTLNYERYPIFREKWFRLAMAYAIDYNKILESGFVSQAVPGTHLCLHPIVYKSYADQYSDIVEKSFPKTVVDAGITRIPYDPEMAIKILQENCDPGGSVEKGWSYKGQKIGGWTITSVVAWRVWAVTTEVAAKNLRDIGIDVQPNLVEVGTYFDAVNRLDYDIITNWLAVIGDPIGIETSMTSNYANPGIGPWWQTKSPGGIQAYWNGSYPPLPNIAGQVKALCEKLWVQETGSAEFNATLRQILEIVVPELPFIPTDITGGMHLWNYIDRWNNWPTIDDPYEFRAGDNGDLVAYQCVKHVYPAKVRTTGFSLSKSTVETGTPVIATVTLKNTGQQVQRYRIVINKGPAMPGWEVFENDILAWKLVKVPPGEMTVDLPVTISEPGSYVLVVDNWRIGKFDPGDPLTAPLSVTKPIPIAGIEETVRATQQAVSRVETSVGNLGTTVDALSKSVGELGTTVSGLSGVVAGTSSLLYATIALQVIVLVLVLVVVARAFRKPAA